MKKLSLLYSLFCVLALGFLTSCGDDEDDVMGPQISFIDSDGTETVDPATQDSVTIEYQITSGDARLSSLQIISNNLPVYTNNDLPRDEFQESLTVAVPAAGTSAEYTFIAIDNDDEQATRVFTITSEGGATALDFEQSGAIVANAIGPNQSAYNLVSNTREAGTATSDMQNPSTDQGTVAEQWIQGWDAETSTRFVRANDDFDYENATLEAAIEEYNSGTETAEVRNVQEGDIYIAQLRGTDQYAVINVTGVDANNPDANDEEITFTYKKASATAGQ